MKVALGIKYTLLSGLVYSLALSINPVTQRARRIDKYLIFKRIHGFLHSKKQLTGPDYSHYQGF